MNMAVRNLALDLLDDEHGINRQAYKSLADWLDDEGCSDIVDAVDACEGRYYIAAETAQELRQVTPE